MMAKIQTPARATLAMMSGWRKPALAVAPRVTPAAALASSPPITSTAMATARLGSQSSSCRSTSDTAGNPSASKATTSTISRMNHFATRARNPAGSVCTPILRTKPAKPERAERSLNRMPRKRAAASRAMRLAINQPTTRITAKAMILGIAAKNIIKPPASEVSIASDQSLMAGNMEES